MVVGRIPRPVSVLVVPTLIPVIPVAVPSAFPGGPPIPVPLRSVVSIPVSSMVPMVSIPMVVVPRFTVSIFLMVVAMWFWVGIRLPCRSIVFRRTHGDDRVQAHPQLIIDVHILRYCSLLGSKKKTAW
jgi:hypothetical protein